MLPKKEAKLIEVINGIDVANELRLFAVDGEEGEGLFEGVGNGVIEDEGDVEGDVKGVFEGEDVGEGERDGDGNEVPHAIK
jgi:hypothetical protein